jgi:transcription-repair coupling factor (superfamily II helicase)
MSSRTRPAAAGSPLWAPLLEDPQFENVARALASGEVSSRIRGLTDAARAVVLELLITRSGRGMWIVVPDDEALEAYERDLSAAAVLVGRDPRRVATLPALDALPYDAIAPHPEVVRARVAALGRLARGRLDALVVPARALLQPLPPRAEWDAWIRVVRNGDTLPPDRFVLWAMSLGYRRVDVVSAPGEVSRRGGILDVFPVTADEPVRIELFADVVDSLRSFDTGHQRSTGQLEEIEIGPAMECPPTEQAIARVARHLDAGLRAVADDDRAVRRFREVLDVLANQGYWPGFHALAGLASGDPVLLFDHAREQSLVVDEPERVELELDRSARELRETYEASANRTLPPPEVLFAEPAKVRDRLRRAALVLEELEGGSTAEISTWDVPCRRTRSYAGHVPEWIDELRRAADERRRTICVMRTPGSTARLREILDEYGLSAADIADPVVLRAATLPPGGLWIGTAALRAGFEMPQRGLQVLAERELFGEERPAADRRGRDRGAFVSDFRDLRPGATVVHVDHGVARYVGLGRPKGGSLNRDFMVLEFQGGDRLFVPVDRLDLVEKYSGVAGHKPALDRLGGPGWQRLKTRVRRSVESMAKELLDLYARRRAAPGRAFSTDSDWQAELEGAFPYDLTPDQERAVEEIKRDMESPQPMDRLLVGDVGFGKTEVAVRAAFKAVSDGAQVAVLAPTTVLAAQHGHTFRERFAPFPARVEVVSRFRSPDETKRVLRDTAAGAVDVLIGTHRLLSADVKFANLGLLVVDEEQRFGVAHKERLKAMSIGVEILSMTATPIPRTLQMSLAGVRDLSLIETAPPGRMAIQTYVIPFRKSVLAQAIRQELRRGGQVFVVHNRIETLPGITRAMTELVPEARVLTAHGKLAERRLEQVMLDFVEHRADVLVTTTIIENGLDIPRANTLIVNRADRFGLAQLYQLRGRVGRSHHHAYAYFLVPSTRRLSEDARKRLRALQEFSDLGAGFRLAAADLEIRGAGELLGPRQHGHIAALGFDLYCRMLEHAVQELKGEPTSAGPPVSLHLGVDIKIPETYLTDTAERLTTYKRLAQARTIADIDRLQADTEDRFGHLPASARNLFELGRLRLVAESAGVKSVDLVEDALQIRFHESTPVEPSRILQIVARERGTLKPSGMLLVPAPPRGVDRIAAVATLLQQMVGQVA